MSTAKQIPTGKTKLYFTAWIRRLCAPASSSARDMAAMNDLDLRDLAIGRSQIPYLFQISTEAMQDEGLNLHSTKKLVFFIS